MHEDIVREYEKRVPLLKQLSVALYRETTEAIDDIDHIDRIAFRVKSSNSFAGKATDPRNNPPYENPYIEIEDQVAGRVIVFFVRDIEVVIDELKGTFGTIESSYRRPAKDVEFGYESHHLICLIPPHLKPNGWSDFDDLPTTFELQVRTIFMHAYAEPQHNIGYKSSQELPSEIRKELAWIAASSWGADQAYQRVSQWSQLQGHNELKNN
jgi:ppGpp synthetase/RelA/SpoT-type nucleotidyltranferase